METQKNYENEAFSKNKTKILQENKEEKTLDERFNEFKKFLKNYQEFNNLEKFFGGSIDIFFQIKNENNISIYNKKGIFKILEKYLQKNIDLKTDENNFKDIGTYKANIENNYLNYLQKGGQKINEIEKILENTENNSKIIEIYFLINYFSFFENIISTLPENKKQYILQNETNPDFNLIQYFNENSGMFLEDDFGNLYLYKYDKNFKTKQTIFQENLPKNEFIQKIISEKNLNLEPKVYFFEPIPENSSWANPLGNDLKIFPKNIQNLEKYSKEEQEKIINGMISNETMHIFLKNIGFRKMEYNFPEIFGKNFLNVPKKYINLNIEEFLSDYASMRIGSKEEVKRIFYTSFLSFLRNINNEGIYGKGYFYSGLFHSEIIKKILGKDISSYFENFSELYYEYLSCDDEKSYINFLKKYSFEEISEKIYQDLENKIIIYNSKKINGIEYLILKNQEKGDEIMERIYQNLK